MSARAGWPLLVFAVTMACFLPALGAGFQTWDDAANFLDNTAYRGLGWTQLKWMFTSTHMGHWIPLTWLTLGLDYAIWGMRPFGYHLTNVLLHAATAVAFYFLGVRLFRVEAAVPRRDAEIGAAAAALVFAVHPLRVESVAWVTERRDVLSGLFYVFTLCAYLRAVSGPVLHRCWYRTTLLLYVAALFSKSMTVSLPVVFLVLDVYPLRRLGGVKGWARRDVWLEKLPFFMLGAAVAVLAFLAVASDAFLYPLAKLDLAARVVLSLYGAAFYLVKTAVPFDLSPLYQFPITVTWLHLAMPVIGTVLAVVLRRRGPAFTALWTVYVATLIPVLGIFHNGPQVVADRYSYLACMGWALLAGGLAARTWCGRGVTRGVLTAVVLAFAVLTWQQSRVWRDSVTLWSHAVVVNPASRAAHANLARGHAAAGQLAPAIAHWEESGRLSVNPAPARVAVAALYERAGLRQAARRRYAEALREQPGLPDACREMERLEPSSSAVTSCD